ncbi:MAG: fatty acid desaturase [Proteobacteria bacterium]|nr:fatty acid desaturase [Pseudomonadota bacterium]
MNSIRSEMNALIVGLVRSRESAPAGLFLILSTIIFAACGAAAAEYLSLLFPAISAVFRCAAVLWIGTRMRALGNMMHECSHGIFVCPPAANTALGHLLAALDLSSFAEYSKQHSSHHAHLGDPDKDLDYRSRFFLLKKRKSVTSVLTVIILSAALVPLWLKILRPVLLDRHAPLWSNLLRFVFWGAAAFACFNPQISFFAIIYVIVPYLTTYQWMKLFSDACDHLFLTEEMHTNDRSRNHLFKLPVLNLIFFPRNDGYHLLHHLFPSLPTHNYPETHSRLLQNRWYASRVHHFEFSVRRKNSGCSETAVHGQSR